MEEIREIGPGVVGRRPHAAFARAEIGRKIGPLQLVRAAHRIAGAVARRRPFGNHEEVLRQAPRRVRFEEPILQHVVACVLPVVGNLAVVVVAHDLDAAGAVGSVGIAAPPAAALRRCDETVHLAAVDVVDRRLRRVRPAAVRILRVVKRPHAVAPARIGHADGRHAVVHRDAVGAGKGAEVGIERAVLLHDDHDVLDLVNRIAALRPHGQRRGRRGQRENQREKEPLTQWRPHRS